MKSRPGQSQAFSLFGTCPLPTLPCRNPTPAFGAVNSLGAINSVSLGERRGERTMYQELYGHYPNLTTL